MSNRAGGNLSLALDEFQRNLLPDQKVYLSSLANKPSAEDVIDITRKIKEKNSDRKSQVFATRIHGVLESIRQYCTIVDTVVGPNQIAAIVWGSVKLVLLVSSLFSVGAWPTLTYPA